MQLPAEILSGIGGAVVTIGGFVLMHFSKFPLKFVFGKESEKNYITAEALDSKCRGCWSVLDKRLGDIADGQKETNRILLEYAKQIGRLEGSISKG
jgi:hypothetical protein